ncbi:MAG TPA: bifunctional (p)ppGpp synthetase/guanosine-3',5'-bis(diphosphate) 3'-pyrophosphohydrolase, partial [Candidatus Limnocylindria bacterium]|nr:bifunctional (p)ppGpp synthetase/guanosine-3',5'-bis(diphosphate) 3'-pyrophosphohydrolase [Candidatus Limnocylindria bacterium]
YPLPTMDLARLRAAPAAVVSRVARRQEAEEPSHTIGDVVAEARRHRPSINAGLIERAHEVAALAHEGQRRASGEPYINHPVEVAHYLATLQMDAETLAAALLHDVPEDTALGLADIEKRFGREVARLVDGVTKLSKFGSARSMEEQQAENIRKMFMAMAEDVRVVIIKLADRLHNMRTLHFLPADKQQRIARQSMEIYAPLAHRLGMWQVKWELEDLSFKYLEPDKYRQLVDMLADRRKVRESFVNRSIAILRKELAKVGISADISGRPKHLYSIYKKMERKGAEFNEIYDLHAIRLLVDDVKDCYAALGVVHSIWRPIPGQFDDYIAMPKANMYQSLHTAVIGPDAKPLEVQIRTRQMHDVAEAGIAAHWRYKEGSRGDRRYDEKLAWVRQLMDWQREVADATEFVEGLKLEVFQDQVFVFTPKGDVKDLPAGATPLDFAYRIHTDVGHRTIGAKANNRLVPLDYKLRNGDIVEIITTKAAHGPSRDWLNIVRTNQAREKIRQWFKRQQRDENIEQGKDLLDRELRRLAHETLATVDSAKLLELAQQAHYRELDDFFAAIGYGAVSPASVVSKLEIHDDAAIALPEVAPPSAVPSVTGVRVKGVGDLLVRFANCCSPIPGDPITGYVTRGKGVTVHRANCPSVLSERDIERLIDVEWESVDQQTYPITVRIEALDRPGLLNEITNVVAEHKINIVAASIGTKPDGTASISATLKVTSLQQLSRVLARIERIRDITSVTREAR